MVSQLLFYTLLACQPKESLTSPTPDNKPSPDTKAPDQTTTHTTAGTRTQASTKPQTEETTETLPKIVIKEEVPKPVQSDPDNNFYAQEVRLGQIPYPSDLSEEDFCATICRSSFRNGGRTIASISNCTLNLIDTWETYRKDFSYKTASQTGNPVVGAVSCNGTPQYIKRGRMGLAKTKFCETDSDLGGYFAQAAQEEGTAVFAFQEFLTHLKKWNAPSELQDRCQEIIQEEINHTLMMAALAQKHGCKEAFVHFPMHKEVSLFEFAKHNALVGCLDETWAAALAQYQADNTPRYHEIFAEIAKDEHKHAQYSWDVHQWLMSQLSASERTEIKEAMQTHLLKTPTANYKTEYGEMDQDNHQRAWQAFQTHVQDLMHAA